MGIMAFGRKRRALVFDEDRSRSQSNAKAFSFRFEFSQRDEAMWAETAGGTFALSVACEDSEE